MIASVALSVLSMSVAQTPQEEYDAYVEQFQDSAAICGTMLMPGRTGLNHNNVFRVAAGGKYHIFYGETDSHFDGTEQTTYYPKDHSYLVSRHEAPAFRVIFGPRFGRALVRPDKVESVRTEVFQGQQVRVFRVDISSKVYPELLVRVSDQVPIAYRGSRADPGGHELIVNFDTTQTFSEESWNWKPPSGARRRT